MKNLLANLCRSLTIAACVSLAACGGGDGTAAGDGPTSADGGPDSPDSSALACEQGHYACSWSGVGLSTIERSIALGEQAAAKLGSGASTAEVGAWLETSETLAEIQYDDGLIRFRLQGGRPVWLGKSSRLAPGASVPAPTSATRRALAAAVGNAGIAPSGTSAPNAADSIVRPGVEQKRALIMVPFRFDGISASGFSAGVKVAASLEATPGYAGHVVLAQNQIATAEDITVDSFGDFRNFDVVFVQSYGGRLCFDERTNQEIPCRSFIDAQRFHGTAIELINSTTTGVELLIWDDLHKDLILTADFFRSQYPGGLKNTLVFLSACSSYADDLVQALQGPSSNYVGWSQTVSELTASTKSHLLFEGMATGRTLQAVYADLSVDGDTHDEFTGADILIGLPTLRLRELLTVRDESSGQPLVSGQSVHIVGQPEDGEADSLSLLIDVEGIEEGEADVFVLHLEIDDKPFSSMVVGDAGAQIGPYAWQVRSSVPLGFDVKSGQVLKIRAWVQLPEGGISSVEVSPEVTEVAVGLGRIYQGTSTRVWNMSAGPTVTAKANVTFELEGPLGQPQLRYNVVGGTMTVTFSDNLKGSICGYSGKVVVPMPVNLLNRLTIDAQTHQYSGYGQSAGPIVQVMEQCPGQEATLVPFDSSSIWFVANEANVFITDGAAIEGDYQSSATSRFNWSFVKVE